MPLFSILYSFPYLIVFGILWLFYLIEIGKIKTKISTKNARKIVFFILLIFIGLRGHVFSDFINYYPFFLNLPPIHKLDLSQFLFEPGFVIYSSLLKTIVPNYFIWVFINTFIDLLVFRHIFKHYTHSQILPFIFFLAYQGLIIEFNLYRNAKAIDFFLLSLPYLQQRKIAPYMLLNLLGATFHISAALYLPLYFVLQKEIPRWLVWSLLIVSNVIFLGNIHFIGDLINNLGIFFNEDIIGKLNRYEEMNKEYGFSFGYFERTFSIILCTILYTKLVRQNPVNIILYNCAFFYYVIFMIFANVSVFSERIPLLFIFSYWILFSNIAVLKYRYRPVVLSLLLAVSVMKVVVGSQNILCYYDNLLWGIKTYEERYQIAQTFFTIKM